MSDRFDIPGIARVVAGNGDLAKVIVTSPSALGEMYLHGGQVTSWTPAGAATDVLFVSRDAVWQPGRAIRGGIPVCFPWFGAHASNSKAPSHGFVRLREWQLESIERVGDDVAVTVGLSSDASTRELWPHDFRVTLRAVFGATLEIALTVANRGAEVFLFEEALHTYLSVDDIRSAAVSGLDGVRYLDTVGGIRERRQGGDIRFDAETDRIYLATTDATVIHDSLGGRHITIDKTHSRNTVVWNPWVARAKAFADFGDDEWLKMLCVETCNVRDAAIAVDAGGSHTMMVSIRHQRLN